MGDRKKPEEVEEFDWEQALSEWDEKSFVPEVARDILSNKPAAISGAPASRPLYRPPPAPSGLPATSGRASPTTAPPDPALGGSARDPVDDDDADATIIAAVPQELLRREAPGRGPLSRGGLSQLFSRDDASPRPLPVPRAGAGFGDEVVTSAQAIMLEPDRAGAEPLKRPSRTPLEDVPDGAFFDPFAPPSGPPIATAPASAEGADERPGRHHGVPVVDFDRASDPLGPGSLWDDGDDDGESPVQDLRHLLREVPGRPVPAPPRIWQDERPAGEWLGEAARAAFEERAGWMEEEARALGDPVGRARGLLTCSELRAILGEWDRAEGLASEARELAPSVALAHRQARTLRAWLSDPEDSLESLDAEASSAPTAPARTHAGWLAADALRARGDAETANRRFEELAQAPGDDARAAVACAIDALARGALSSAALNFSGLPALRPLARAAAVCKRLRGESEGADGDADEWLPNEVLVQARRALAEGDLAACVSRLSDLARVPGLAPGARWLAAAIGATIAARRGFAFDQLYELVCAGDDNAVRPLIARAIELGDQERVESALAAARALDPADHVVLAILAGRPLEASDARWQETSAVPATEALAVAASAYHRGSLERDRPVAADTAATRAEVNLGRRLAARAGTRAIAQALAVVDATTAAARGVGVEIAIAEQRADTVCGFVGSWGASLRADHAATTGHLAAGLIAERMGDSVVATRAYEAAYEAEPACEAALRALVSLEPRDAVGELNAFADECGTGLRSALARIEAVARGAASLPVPTQRHLLELAQRAAPDLPLAGWLAERMARRSGDVEDALRWMRERRPAASEPMEAAIEAVREALLLVDRDPELARERMGEAHAARPDDVGLRELYERMTHEAPDDWATWREHRAAGLGGTARALMLLEASYAYERGGDAEGAFRSASAVLSSIDSSLARVARERAELRTERSARLADELLAFARHAVDPRDRYEAYERLAVLDAAAQNDTASAVLWHRSVLEISPEHAASLRHVEHHLIGEGREDELEPIAAAIAKALGGDAGEATAHAELSARLRMRADASRPEWAREMLDVAAAPADASLSALRLLYAEARVQGDDVGVLAAARRLVERGSRPLEVATLLARAGEAALRLQRTEEACALFERAVVEDAGDCVGWARLADARSLMGNSRGAAEAFECVARCSRGRTRQLVAAHEAARRWMDDDRDVGRAVAALETAAALDLGYADVFDRLARLYADRGMNAELAELLERRAGTLNDPAARVTLEVWRGRVLLEGGEIAGARRAFEAALAERPDDPGALSAFADLCRDHGDWAAAEQALVRLSRLLPTVGEQKSVYLRLGELYSHRLVNLARAEVAYREVLKRAPDDVETLERLVDVHKRQNDPARAIEIQQGLVDRAATAQERRGRIIELAAIHERVSHDLRRAEKTLETARRDAPHDVALLRALAEFYARHQQTPAVNILLDRATTDARRALAAGRITSDTFEVVAAAFDLRGDGRASRVARGMLAAVAAERTDDRMQGAADRAFDRGLDDWLAPEMLSSAIRSLVAKAGDALEPAAPLDLRELRTSALPTDNPLARRIARVATSIGISGLQVLASPALGPTCVSLSDPPTLVVGTSILGDERAGTFLALRALHLVGVHATALARLASSSECALAVTSWLKALNPSWETEAFSNDVLQPRVARVRGSLPRTADPDVATLALEAAAALEGRPVAVAAAALSWANRVAWLATGDANAALDAIAIASGRPAGAPRDPRDRVAWIARTPEARDLVAFVASEGWLHLTRARPDLIAFK